MASTFITPVRNDYKSKMRTRGAAAREQLHPVSAQRRKFDDSTQKPIEMMRLADSEREKPPIQVRRQTGIDDARAISSAQSRASAQPSSGC
jgi:hypothetical protein